MWSIMLHFCLYSGMGGPCIFQYFMRQFHAGDSCHPSSGVSKPISLLYLPSSLKAITAKHCSDIPSLGFR